MLAANLLGRRQQIKCRRLPPFRFGTNMWIGSCKSLRAGYVHHPKSIQIANLQSFMGISTHLFAANNTWQVSYYFHSISFLQAHLKSIASSPHRNRSPNGPAPKLSAKGFPNWFGAALMAATTTARTCQMGQVGANRLDPPRRSPFCWRWYTQEIYPLCKSMSGVYRVDY